MECKNLFIVMLIILPFCTHCQDGTTVTSAGPSASTAQPTAAIVQENITKPTTTAKPGVNITSESAGSPNTSGNDSATTSSTPATATLATEDGTTDETTATIVPDENDSSATTTQGTIDESIPDYYELCPSSLPCEMLGAQCLNCSMDTSCVYGREYNTTCYPKQGLDCVGVLPLQKTYQCRYCYQTEPWQQSCTPANNCQVYACPKQYIRVNCTVDEDILCLGSRNFHRRKHCNWTSGSKWSTALILSITLGGFGADRFYLGYWQSGLGKLFSFGGAGVWTLIDVLLIAVGYITPSDGSHYIY